MADRVSLSLYVHGPINSIEALNDLAEAIGNDFGDEDQVLPEIQSALLKGKPSAYFEAEEAMASMDAIREACARHSIFFVASYGGHYEWSDGRYVLHPDNDGEDECGADTDGKPRIELAEFEGCFSGDVINSTNTRALIARYRRLAGQGLPKLAASPEVLEYLTEVAA